MRKFLIALVMLVAFSAKAEVDVASLAGVGWSATQAEVVKQYDGKLLPDGNVTAVMESDTARTLLAFIFKSSKLERIEFSTFLKTTDLQQVSDTCIFVGKKLIEENGEPEFIKDKSGNLVLAWQGSTSVAMYACKESIPGGPVLMLIKKAKADMTL